MSLILIERIANLNGPIIPDTLNGVLNGSEIDAHKFVITATRDGAQVALTGAVTASFLRADGAEVVLTGEIESGAATVTLAQSCYAVPGRFDLTVFVTADGVKTGVYACTGGVRNTTSGTIIDPGQVVPDVDDIVAQYDEMQRVTAEAQAAAGTALSAASGIGDTQVATFNAQGAATSGAGEDGHTFTLGGGGVSPTGGTNSSGVDLCRLGYTGIGTPLLLTVDTSEYQWCVWIYTGQSTGSKIRSLTNNGFTTGPVVIPNTEGAKYFRVGFKRIDGATVTEEMRAALAAQMHIYALTDTTLTTSGAAADAKAVGDRLDQADTGLAALGTEFDAYAGRDPYRLVRWIKNQSSDPDGPTGSISSLTVIEDRLFVFKYATGNESTTGSRIYLFNADGTITPTGDTFTSDIGHANSVDWKPLTGYLVAPRTTMTGDSETLYCLYLFPGVTAATRAFERANALKIDIDTTLTVGGSTVFGPYRLNACWGPDNLGKGDLLYVISDDGSSNASGTRHLALLQLGKGANTLSYGTAVSASDTEFNGTFNVVSALTQSWVAVNGISQGDNDLTYWGGKIYELPAPTSTAGFPLMIHSFDDFGATWKTERILIPHRLGSGAKAEWEKEGIAIYNGHMYIGSHSAGLFVTEF